MNTRILCLLGLTAALTSAESPDLLTALNLEAHGFVSFGYLESERNNWLGSTTSGTGQFWEAAANVIARPMDRLRIGAQVFARDLVKYDNGRVDLDWAYADYRADDVLGVQVGRVKLPLALYNEALDVDAARTQVFLPPAVYALRSRDLFISVDGVKVYGSVQAGALGSFDYGVFLGAKNFNEDAGFAGYLSELGLGPVISEISADWAGGGMLHWNTPINGLGVRLSIGDLHNFTVRGRDPLNAMTKRTTVEDYTEAWVSLIYELPEITLAAEYTRVRGRGETRIDPGAFIVPLADNGEGAYLGCTWHMTAWFEAYAGFEATWTDAYARADEYAYTGVFAANLRPLPSWSLKLEVRGVRGTRGINPEDNPDGIDDRWGVVALKTTVDF
ncbi:MAG: hypothetical protein H0W78_19115 [Planctomycetes bacterium]|nr:hypothetical protein [Planctomycetota bacterium]